MEGFGLVIVEAAAAGLPIVASAIPGIEEAARAAFAPVLVDPSDPHAFGRAVCECLSRPAADFRPEPALLRPYSIESSVQQLTGIYDNLAAVRVALEILGPSPSKTVCLTGV